MTRRLQLLAPLGLLLASSLGGTAGCAAESTTTDGVAPASPSPVAQNSDASLVVDVAEPGHLVGHYRRGDLSLRFEAKRGAATPAAVRESDPDAPAYEIDARFVSASGEAFSVRVGGHTFADADWIAESNVERADPDAGRRREEFLAASEVAIGLGALSLSPEVAPEVEALVALGRAVPPLQDDPSRHLPATSPSPGTSSVASALTSSAYTHRFEIWTKPVRYRGITTWYDHSSTRTLSQSAGGSTVSSRITCNHGTCAAASTMTLKCASSYSGRASALPNMPQCPTTQVGENYSSYGCCASAYSLWGDGGHLCHDDTMFQRDIVRAWTRTIPYPSFCTDQTSSWYAPSCITGSGGGGW